VEAAKQVSHPTASITGKLGSYPSALEYKLWRQRTVPIPYLYSVAGLDLLACLLANQPCRRALSIVAGLLLYPINYYYSLLTKVLPGNE
jgi:hypothetical protein